MTIIDRFEGNIAVLETDSGMMDIDRSLLPENAAEGDVLTYENGAWVIDRQLTDYRRSRIQQRLHRLMKKEENND